MHSRNKRKNDSRYFTGGKKLKEEVSHGQLEKDTFEYFRRIADVLKGNLDEEEITTLAANTLQQTEGIELDVCKHIVSATVIEKIIPYCPWSEIKRITTALNNDNEEFRGKCESRLEETIIKDAGRRIRLTDSEEKDECLEYLTNKSEDILQKFENSILEMNFNYCARTCLIVNSGYVEKGNNNTVISKNIVKQFSKKMMKWTELADCYQRDAISGFLQILLYSLKAVSEKNCKKFVKFLIENCFLKDFEEQSDNSVKRNFENVSWTRLLEATIEVSPPDIQDEIYQKLFSNHLETLVTSMKGHFPVYKLISTCKNKLTFGNMLEKLNNKISDIIAANNLNILHAISEGCINTGEKQGEFVKNLTSALECSGPNKEKYVVICIISLKAVSKLNIDDFSINFHGSLIFQNILKFKKPHKFVEALLSLNVSTLKRILTDSKGCFLSDAFMLSPHVGAKSKDRLLNILKGHYSDLAMSKYGSRTFDVIWSNASMKNRSIILSEMSRKIMQTQFGTIIASKTGLEMYIRDKNAWEKAYNSSDKTTLFANIIKPKH